MGRESRRDADDGERRHRRRAQHHSEGSPSESRVRAPEPPSMSRPLPHRGKLQPSRFDEGTLRGNAATTSPSSSSQDGSELVMPPPPPSPPRLVRSQTIAYSKRYRDPIIYDDERLALAPLRRSRTQVSPEDHRRRPRLTPKLSSVSSSGSSSSLSTDSEDDDVDNESSDDEQEDEYEYEGRVLESIEAVEEADDEASRERKPKHGQRNGPVGYPEDARHRQSRHKNRSPSTNETRPRRRHHHSADEHKSLTRRSSLTPSDVDRSPPTSRRRKVASVIEGSRPPVSAQRSSKHSRKPIEVVHHETPPRRSNTVASGRSSTRSSSRRTPSILGSFFGGPPSRHSPEKPVKLVECVICMSDISSREAPKLKCGHRMCYACLRRSFRLSITDPQHMPPKCCTQDHIPLKHVENLFANSFKKTWNHKFAEYSTRNRIYCPAKKCGEWIKPENIRRVDGRKVGRCGQCKTKVCGTCNGKWHSSAKCPRDEETNQFLKQAKEEGWQRCFGCKAMVELKEGCNHMTCRCGAEFCMICGTKWKNCDCPWFNYEAFDTEQVGMRGNMRDIFAEDGPPAPSEGWVMSGMVPPPAPSRPSTYEEEMLMRRIQEQRDADLARRMQLHVESDDDYDPRRGVPDILGVGSSSGHMMNEDYRRARRRMAAPSPPPAAPTVFDRGPDYVSDVSRARGLRATSQERRLADRFSESRYTNGPRPGMGSPVSPHGFSPMSPIRPPPVGLPPVLSPMSMAMPMPMPPPPPMSMPMSMPMPMPMPMSMPIMPSHPMYHTPPPEHMVSVPMPHAYDIDFEAHAPRSRRPGREGFEAPKSSTLAGLTGPGSGMNRVYEWRNFVEPGVPEDEVIAGRA